MTTKSGTLKRISDALTSDDDKGVIVAVAVALLIISVVTAGYYVRFRSSPEGYSSIYVLDSQGKAANYTEILFIDQNVTYDVWVVNHKRQSVSFEVQLKISKEPVSLLPVNSEPISVYRKTLEDGEKWEIPASVTLHDTGSYIVAFELWIEQTGELEFTGNSVILKIDTINQP